MIKCELGKVSLKGDAATLMAELSCIISSLEETFSENISDEKAKEMILHAVDIAFKPEEEVKEATKDELVKLLKLLLKDE